MGTYQVRIGGNWTPDPISVPKLKQRPCLWAGLVPVYAWAFLFLEHTIMTLEQLKAQREALQAARLSGVFQIKAGDKWITYRSDKEIQAALADVDREIAQMEGRPRPRRIRAYCSKGL